MTPLMFPIWLSSRLPGATFSPEGVTLAVNGFLSGLYIDHVEETTLLQEIYQEEKIKSPFPEGGVKRDESSYAANRIGQVGTNVFKKRNRDIAAYNCCSIY